MKKIIIALLALLSVLQSFAQSDDTTQYTYYKFSYGTRSDRLWANKVLRAPLDTIFSKSGLAILGGTLYVGNGTKWSQVTGGGGTADSITFYTKYRSDTARANIYAGLFGKQALLSNAGSGYRAFLPGASIRTFFAGLGIKIDSTSNTNGLTLTIDTTYAATLLALKDSSTALRNLQDTLLVLSDGQPGDSLVSAAGGAIHTPRIRDSLGFHRAKNPDGSQSWYVVAGSALPSNDGLANPILQNTADNTKKQSFDLTNHTTSTTRLDSFPDASGMIALTNFANEFRLGQQFDFGFLFGGNAVPLVANTSNLGSLSLYLANVYMANLIAPNIANITSTGSNPVNIKINGVAKDITTATGTKQWPVYDSANAVLVTNPKAILVTDSLGNVGTVRAGSAAQVDVPSAGAVAASNQAVRGDDPRLVTGNNLASYFSPADIPGLVAWYDMGDFSTITLSNTRVKQINDKSGNGNHLIQTDTTKSPQYIYRGGGNNLSYVNVASGRTMTATGVTVGQPYTVYIVVQQTGTADQGNLWQFGSTNVNGIAQKGPSNGKYSLCEVAASNWQPQDVMSVHPGWTVYKFTFNGLSSSMEVNEELKYLSYYTNGQNPGSVGVTQITLGGTNVQPSAIGHGEMIMVAGITGAETDKKMKDYLMLKYGLTNNDFIAWFGDSITAGNQLAVQDSCFAYVVTNSFTNKDYYNYGKPSTTVFQDAFSFLWSSSFLRGGNNGYAVISYGTNDYSGGSGYDSITWKLNLESIVQRLINYGYSKSKIFLMTPEYQPTHWIRAGIVVTMGQAATDLGVGFINMWDYTRTISGGCPLLDDIHPNGTCNQIMATYIETFIH